MPPFGGQNKLKIVAILDIVTSLEHRSVKALILLYSKTSVYRSKVFYVNYNDVLHKIVFLKSSKLQGFDEILKSKRICCVNKFESLRCSLSRTKKNIKEIALCNDFEFFYTQTINKKNCDRYNLLEVQELIQKKFKAYKRKNKNFKYLIIYEHHKDGGIHLHGLVKGLNFEDIYKNDNGYMSSHFFDKIGFNSFSEIKEYIKCCNYITKYITSDMIKNHHNQLYFCSKNLTRASKIELDVTRNCNFAWTYQNNFVKIFEE